MVFVIFETICMETCNYMRLQAYIMCVKQGPCCLKSGCHFYTEFSLTLLQLEFDLSQTREAKYQHCEFVFRFSDRDAGERAEHLLRR